MKTTTPDYTKTVRACFAAFIVQAIVDFYAALLFVQFHREFGISLARLTLLVTFNFLVQLTVDILSVKLVDRIGYRTAVIAAHVFSAAGLGLMCLLPDLTGDPFTGLLIAVIVYSMGGGLLEVVLSPIVEACPTANKEKTMSLLHSFYSWGLLVVTLLSTLFFQFFTVSRWRLLTALWMIFPIVNGLRFIKLPFADLIEEGQTGMSLKALLTDRAFWAFFLMMICSGAADQAVTQWSSALAEMSLGVSKTMGDLAGPTLFAVCMGSARIFYGKFGHRIDLGRYVTICTVINLAATLMIALMPGRIFAFIGCGLCGLSVAAMWPGTLSQASASLRTGGNALFALLALGGDIGCSIGPTIAGFAASAFNDNLRVGLGVASVFPAGLLILLLAMRRGKAKPA